MKASNLISLASIYLSFRALEMAKNAQSKKGEQGERGPQGIPGRDGVFVSMFSAGAETTFLESYLSNAQMKDIVDGMGENEIKLVLHDPYSIHGAFAAYICFRKTQSRILSDVYSIVSDSVFGPLRFKVGGKLYNIGSSFDPVIYTEINQFVGGCIQISTSSEPEIETITEMAIKMNEFKGQPVDII